MIGQLPKRSPKEPMKIAGTENFFTEQMSLLSPNQECQSKEGTPKQ